MERSGLARWQGPGARGVTEMVSGRLMKDILNLLTWVFGQVS